MLQVPNLLSFIIYITKRRLPIRPKCVKSFQKPSIYRILVRFKMHFYVSLILSISLKLFSYFVLLSQDKILNTISM